MIGAGKTTFITQYSQYLEDHYGVPVKVFLEPVEGNELLTMMYENPTRWTYTSQVRFLVDKLNSIRKAMESKERIVLIERDYKEQKIFINTQLAVGSVTQIEYDSYMELYNTCAEFLPSVVNYHIKVPNEICSRRRMERGRLCESLGSKEYYNLLYLMYEKEYQDHPEEYIIEDTLDIGTYQRLDRITFEGVYS